MDSLHLLLVEDDEIDVEVMERALRVAGPYFSLTVARNGVEALQLLQRPDGQPAFLPSMIFLDLNMPVMNGIDFLRALRHDPNLKRSIVFVLTTSNLESDKLAAYQYNVAGYLLKSGLGETTARLLELLEAYRKTVVFPTLSQPGGATQRPALA